MNQAIRVVKTFKLIQVQGLPGYIVPFSDHNFNIYPYSQ